MCIVSNWVNQAQDLMAVKKYDDLPNSLIPSGYILFKCPLSSLYNIVKHRLHVCCGKI